jgi:hypothetical protein
MATARAIQPSIYYETQDMQNQLPGHRSNHRGVAPAAPSTRTRSGTAAVVPAAGNEKRPRPASVALLFNLEIASEKNRLGIRPGGLLRPFSSKEENLADERSRCEGGGDDSAGVSKKPRLADGETENEHAIVSVMRMARELSPELLRAFFLIPALTTQSGNQLCQGFVFTLLLGDEYDLSAPRSGAPWGGAGGGGRPSDFSGLRGRGGRDST